MRSLSDEMLAVRVHPDDIIRPYGKYKFGWRGYVDFEEKTWDHCGCGGCCIAERSPFAASWKWIANPSPVAWGKQEAKGWLERIQSGPGEPPLYRIAR